MRLAFVGPPDARSGIVVLHPGAWWLRAQDALEVERPQAERWAADGLLAVDVDYRNGIYGVADARRAYDALAAHLPPGAPICVFGESAGAHLGLLLAERRPAACVIARAPVVTPRRLLADGDPVTFRFARLAFGRPRRRWRAVDVLRHAERLPPALLTVARDDEVVCPAQARRLAAAAPQVALRTLDPGDAPFTHGTVDAAQLAEAARAEEDLVIRATTTRPARRRWPHPAAP